MNYYHDEDEWETVGESRTCEWHKKHPNMKISSCTCSASWGLKKRDPAEVAKIKARKLQEHEDNILLEAEAIKIRRKALADAQDP